MNERRLGFVWALLLGIIALFLMLNVNFGFQEKMLKEELVEHTAFKISGKSICVCPVCGKKGFAYCVHCGKPMAWDRAREKFICIPCHEIGMPSCPNCGTGMVGNLLENTANFGTGEPVAVF